MRALLFALLAGCVWAQPKASECNAKTLMSSVVWANNGGWYCLQVGREYKWILYAPVVAEPHVFGGDPEFTIGGSANFTFNPTVEVLQIQDADTHISLRADGTFDIGGLSEHEALARIGPILNRSLKEDADRRREEYQNEQKNYKELFALAERSNNLARQCAIEFKAFVKEMRVITQEVKKKP